MRDTLAPVEPIEAFEPPLRRALLRVYRVFAGPTIEPSYHLTRTLLLRSLGLVYLVAFLVATQQLVPLLGETGLTPIAPFLERVAESHPSRREAMGQLPSLFWFDASDTALTFVAWAGTLVAALVVLGLEHGAAWLLLWVLYFSIVAVGQRWYAFGWESQLLETGFIALFWAPWGLRWRVRGSESEPDPSPPSQVPLWLYRWLIVRIMLGAGLIKLRGDPCWTELSCLDYHFETQPIPGPLSPYFHALPKSLLAAGVAFNHLAELVLPFFVFGPRRARHVAGALILAFQVTLILSGNLAFLNWLTIVPALACFDDQLLERLVPARFRARLAARVEQPRAPPKTLTRAFNYGFAAVVVWLSLPVVANLLGRSQAMNRSYDRFHLVNTYGAFGSVGDARLELIIEGSASPDPDAPSAVWQPYEFECKPGALDRRPCLITPYHLRLDWLAWFAALDVQYNGRLQREDWVLHLVYKLLDGDPAARELLDEDRSPFADAPPQWIRIEVYRYELAPPRWGGPGPVWTREFVGELIPPIAADDPRLRAHLERRGWLN